MAYSDSMLNELKQEETFVSLNQLCADLDDCSNALARVWTSDLAIQFFEKWQLLANEVSEDVFKLQQELTEFCDLLSARLAEEEGGPSTSAS